MTSNFSYLFRKISKGISRSIYIVFFIFNGFCIGDYESGFKKSPNTIFIDIVVKRARVSMYFYVYYRKELFVPSKIHLFCLGMTIFLPDIQHFIHKYFNGHS